MHPGAATSEPVINTDLMPTLLALTRIAPPEGLDGSSFAGLLTGGARQGARTFFWHIPHYTKQGGRPGGAVREGNWKLIEDHEDGRVELFNLEKDPLEANDLAEREPARAAAMRKRLAEWRASVGAQENSPNPDFDPSRTGNSISRLMCPAWSRRPRPRS